MLVLKSKGKRRAAEFSSALDGVLKEKRKIGNI
jgi:hypothetical protein